MAEGVTLPPPEPSRIFPETKNEFWRRQFSVAADERVINKLGTKMKFSEGVLFMMNSLTGLSLLTLPYGFHEAGLVLGAAIILGCMVVSFMTATFMCEALTIANALEYEEAERQVLEEQTPEVRKALHDAVEQVAAGEGSLRKKLLEGTHPPGAFRGPTLEVFQAENRVKNPDREFKIRERVELGAVGERVLQRPGPDKVIAAVIYMMILAFTYGTVSALVVTVNQSLAHTLLGAASLLGIDQLREDQVYTPCVIGVFFITLPLCFKNLQNTKKFTVVIMWCRFLAIAILLVVGIYKSIQRVRHESFEILQDIPLWKPSGFVAVFGNSVFLCGIHHYLPSMISPLKEQTQAPRVIITAFSSCYCLILGICGTALVAWGEESAQNCSSMPGGHYCQIQPLYNLNFAPLSLGGGSVALFLLAYPAMAIASIPIAAITTRNTMGQWLGVKPADPDAPYTFSNICLTMAVLVPPFTVALITTNVQAVIQYVGGYAGLSVSFLCPMILLIRCREILNLRRDNDVERPLKSPFANRFGYLTVTLLYLFALYMVTKRLFFEN